MVPANGRGEALGPVVTWFDVRPAAPPGATGPVDPEAFHRRTGTWWHRMYWTVRLPWLRAQLGQRVRFLGLPELVLTSLLGEMPMSVSMASGTGLLDLAHLRWDDEACALAGVRPGELPDLAPAHWRGRLLPGYANRWPSLRNIPWMPPTGDGAASNFGSGCEDERRAAVTVGTSAAVRIVQDAAPGATLPPLPWSLWRYRVDHDRIVTGAAYSAGGNLFKWARTVLRLPEESELEAELDRVEPGKGVWADPRLGGDRPPGTAAHGAGELRGIGFTTSAVQIWAGLMDAGVPAGGAGPGRAGDHPYHRQRVRGCGAGRPRGGHVGLVAAGVPGRAGAADDHRGRRAGGRCRSGVPGLRLRLRPSAPALTSECSAHNARFQGFC